MNPEPSPSPGTNPQQASKLNLLERFPSMRPVKKPPTLMTVNGIGLSMYGHRDEDEPTGAYVKTQCLCVLFIPLFALGAYRVVDSREGGWYFLGRESLSRFAKGWNALILCLLLAVGGGSAWNTHVTSPDYLARQELRQAHARLQAGDALGAARGFAKLVGGSIVSAEARQGLQSALEACLRSSSAVTNEGAFTLMSRLGTSINRPTPLIPDVLSRGLAMVEQRRASDPDTALRLFDAVAALEPKNTEWPARRLELLKAVVAAQPERLERVIELALHYEKEENLEECTRLLTPHQAKLAATEGARLLGQGRLRQGKFEEAYGLLFPYVQERLTKLRALERGYTNAIASSYRDAMNHLRFNKADPSFYSAYEKASKPQQEEMVEKFVQKWMAKDSVYQRALSQLKEANPIVHVTLDLGLVQLNRAQSFSDAAQRHAELEAAEKTFLAIRGLAGETDEYRLFLGQVYYWLGRGPEGKALFDQLLASKERSYATLMALADTLREVGEHAQARDILEEAHRVGKSAQDKSRAAVARAVVARTVDEKIAWLEKADATDVATQVALNDALGDRALERGQKEAAANYYRKAIASFDNMRRSAPVLNNSGLTYLSLYEATGRPEDLNEGVSRLEQAVALDPGNSILLVNTTHTLLYQAVADLLRDRVRLDLVRERPDFSAISLLYDNDKERRDVYQRLRDMPNTKKALVQLDRALLLSPKSRGLYRAELFFQRGFEDQTELQKLLQRVRTAQLDDREEEQEAQKVWAGDKNKEQLQALSRHIQRLETLEKSEAVRQHPGTLEYVTHELNQYRLAAAPYGLAVDTGEVLASARRLYEQRPSSAARTGLIAAHAYAAVQELARDHAEINELVSRTTRVLHPSHLVTLMLQRGGPTAEFFRQNSNVQALVALELESGRLFPTTRDADDWALFHGINSEEAARIVPSFQGNPARRLADEIESAIAPAAGSSILTRFWTLTLLGEPAKAREVYQHAVRLGAGLPPLPEFSATAQLPAAPTGEALAHKE